MESVFFIFTTMESAKKIQSLLINKFSHTTILLACIFCGAIVGENVSLSLVVSAFGSTIISKLYLVNGRTPVFFTGTFF
jgi:hypothetical protein